ncbi:hypothetical protein D5018_20645 [Parashewanella curva]|uniref:Uncharacterized protein n=1 Tax=Parashewanella curva TaxID=2338552 RepID=A0A3L8PQY4_9GAMM|nr:hypothetical protein [Parashewanella curva]RLV57801.1 hypothetical protein D5018_20645 [Parashewanella curva]
MVFQTTASSEQPLEVLRKGDFSSSIEQVISTFKLKLKSKRSYKETLPYRVETFIVTNNRPRPFCVHKSKNGCFHVDEQRSLWSKFWQSCSTCSGIESNDEFSQKARTLEVELNACHATSFNSRLKETTAERTTLTKAPPMMRNEYRHIHTLLGVHGTLMLATVPFQVVDKTGRNEDFVNIPPELSEFLSWKRAVNYSPDSVTVQNLMANEKISTLGDQLTVKSILNLALTRRTRILPEEAESLYQLQELLNKEYSAADNWRSALMANELMGKLIFNDNFISSLAQLPRVSLHLKREASKTTHAEVLKRQFKWALVDQTRSLTPNLVIYLNEAKQLYLSQRSCTQL